MAEIHIFRTHALGREAALQLSREWQAQAEQDWGLRCTAHEQEGQQHIAFERPGLQGSLRVSAEVFELRLTLGFLLSAYRGRIEAELQQRLDGWLDTQPEA
jgi:putative polyhydroxyalkanoate system protein